MNVDFTGEYFVPGAAPKRIQDDHLERYKFTTSFVKGKTVLDIACGVGYGTNLLAQAGALRADGVDISPDLISYAKSTFQEVENVSFCTGNICHYQAPSQYDVITCFETIEHVEDYLGALANLHTLLKRDGLLCISSPNRLITSPRADSLTDKPSNKFHVQEFTVEELGHALRNSGFSVDPAEIFGQRQQRYFSNKYIRTLYTHLVNPKERLSPRVTQVTALMPRYFVLLARKAKR